MSKSTGIGKKENSGPMRIASSAGFSRCGRASPSNSSKLGRGRLRVKKETSIMASLSLFFMTDVTC